VDVGDAKRNANIHNSAFYYAVNKLGGLRRATKGARKRDCRSIANAVDAAISNSINAINAINGH
jgi:hypothetical protein